MTKYIFVTGGVVSSVGKGITVASIGAILKSRGLSVATLKMDMIENILPKAVKESIPFNELLEIDFQWICRCLRLLNYGPYHTTNAILCDSCGQTSFGEYQVNLNTIQCKPLPEGFVNDIVSSPLFKI